MRPLIVTNLAGERRRLNPLAIEGWTAAEHVLERPAAAGGGTAILIGSKIALGSGRVVDARETVRELDILFVAATADPDQVAAIHEVFGTALLDAEEVDPDATPIPWSGRQRREAAA